MLKSSCAHFAQCGDVDLGVHLCGRQRDVAEMVGNILHRKSFGQQMSGAGVPKPMRAITRRYESQPHKPLPHLRTEASRREWPEWLNLREKHFTARASRAHFTQITQYRFSHGRHQGITLGLALLGAVNADHFLFPVDVVQAELPHLAAAKPIDGNEQQHGVVANISWTVAGGCLQKAFHIAPRRSLRQAFKLVNARRIDGVNQPRCAPAPGLRKAYEVAQYRDMRHDSGPLPAVLC